MANNQEQSGQDVAMVLRAATAVIRALLKLHENHHNHPQHAAARALLRDIDEQAV